MFASMGTDLERSARAPAWGASTFGAKNAGAGSEGRGMMGTAGVHSRGRPRPTPRICRGVGNLFAHGLVGPFNAVVTGMP